MSQLLPSDLAQAESWLHRSIKQCLSDSTIKTMSVNLKFEGLRIMPVVIRLHKALNDHDNQPYLVWSDPGASSLAKRDNKEQSNVIFTYKELLQEDLVIDENKLLICVSPQPYDYELFESLCDKHSGIIIVFNGKLEDGAVGIGSVGRERRKGLLSSLYTVFHLEPLSGGALIKCYPEDWELFKSYNDGFRYLTSSPHRPTPDEISEALSIV